MIRFTDVVKEYAKGGTALTGVSFNVAKGEFAFLTGPSGSGKSTLLKLAYFDEWPTRGEVETCGVRSSAAQRKDVPFLRRKLGIVFQDYRLLPDRTAEQNVAFALEVTGAPQDTIRDRAVRALAQVGLASKGTALPQELSGGERQRVAIARAVVNRPLVLLADEPTGNLDERAARGVLQLLQEINAAGTAVLMATHNLDLVRSVDMRVIELSRGAIAFDSGDGAPPAVERTS
ncbi:cell division ATP-binding protein FtsE [Gemmatirosa kalamazoonensis]|uniref:Cell division ATP-binding protein FtsE n=1 Tax=Gemmatirosa kalamazoonensis TaxID=861299 RepID=W0RKL5_9BACT|nr:cell division ATP-binding protein FtsE [Gemmatirosa kalamazoonensis]AHG91296.1 cell division ATP-binding protein FtsE [Gemmatirosa kalamazoonensis]